MTSRYSAALSLSTSSRVVGGGGSLLVLLPRLSEQIRGSEIGCREDDRLISDGGELLRPVNHDRRLRPELAGDRDLISQPVRLYQPSHAWTATAVDSERRARFG